MSLEEIDVDKGPLDPVNFIERWMLSSRFERGTIMSELSGSMCDPLKRMVCWKVIAQIKDTIQTVDLHAATCLAVCKSLQGCLEDLKEVDVQEQKIIIDTQTFCVSEILGPVCLTEGPELALSLLSSIFASFESLDGPEVRPNLVALIVALQNIVVDHFVAFPPTIPPFQNSNLIKFWFNGITFALKTTRFNPRSSQVISLCSSISDAFFGGNKLSSVLKKLHDIIGQIDDTRTDYPYLFDVHVCDVVNQFCEQQGKLMGFSFLWAALKGFLLRISDDRDYESALMVLTHFLQATGAPIRCMATQSLLKYPTSSLDDNERLFHITMLLDIYVASGSYHPSVLASTNKKIKGNLIFQDILSYILKHEAKGTVDWYKALLNLATISPAILMPKLKIVLQMTWFDCQPDDQRAQNDFLCFLIGTYSKMHKSSDLFCKFLGAANDYLNKEVAPVRVSQEVLFQMRMSFASLPLLSVIEIWSNYVKYLQQVMTKYKDSKGTLSDVPQTFCLQIFCEFIQHCSLVSVGEATEDQQQKLSTTIEDTLKVTALLQEIIKNIPNQKRALLPEYSIIMQKYIKSRLLRSYYLDGGDILKDIDEAAEKQEELCALVDKDIKMFYYDVPRKMLKLDITCNSIKTTKDSKNRANCCLAEINNDMESINWQSILTHHPQVLDSASNKHIDDFIEKVYLQMRENGTLDGHFIESQIFRNNRRLVETFAKLVIKDFAGALEPKHSFFNEILDIENVEGTVLWKKLLGQLGKAYTKVDMSYDVSKFKEMFSFVPVQSLSPEVRMKVLATTLTIILCQEKLNEDFLSDALFVLEDLSSAVKLPGVVCDNDFAVICELVTRCVERALSQTSTLSLKNLSVKKLLDLIHFLQFTAFKKNDNISLAESIIKHISLKNDAGFCAMFSLVRTLDKIHSKNINEKDTYAVREKCKDLMNKSLLKGSFKLSNMFYVASKYTEMFGIEDALRVQSINIAFKSAAEAILTLRDGPDMIYALTLCLQAAKCKQHQVIPVRSVVFSVLLLGEDHLQVLKNHLKSNLLEDVMTIVCNTLNDVTQLVHFIEGIEGDHELSFTRSPLSIRIGSSLVTSREIFNRCLSLLPTIVKDSSSDVTTATAIQKVSSLLANQGPSEIRIDLICEVIETASKRRPCLEVFNIIFIALNRIPIAEARNHLHVEEWATSLGLLCEVIGRALLFKANFRSGYASVLVGTLARIVSATVMASDRCKVTDMKYCSRVVAVIDKIIRVMYIGHRLRRQGKTRNLDKMGGILVQHYLESSTAISTHPKLRTDLHTMAFVMLGLCSARSLSLVKMESGYMVQEAFRRLIEEYQTIMHVKVR